MVHVVESSRESSEAGGRSQAGSLRHVEPAPHTRTKPGDTIGMKMAFPGWPDHRAVWISPICRITPYTSTLGHATRVDRIRQFLPYLRSGTNKDVVRPEAIESMRHPARSEMRYVPLQTPRGNNLNRTRFGRDPRDQSLDNCLGFGLGREQNK